MKNLILVLSLFVSSLCYGQEYLPTPAYFGKGETCEPITGDQDFIPGEMFKVSLCATTNHSTCGFTVQLDTMMLDPRIPFHVVGRKYREEFESTYDSNQPVPIVNEQYSAPDLGGTVKDLREAAEPKNLPFVTFTIMPTPQSALYIRYVIKTSWRSSFSFQNEVYTSQAGIVYNCGSPAESMMYPAELLLKQIDRPVVQPPADIVVPPVAAATIVPPPPVAPPTAAVVPPPVAVVVAPAPIKTKMPAIKGITKPIVVRQFTKVKHENYQ